MNTSMTINATAAWLLSLYIAVADERGIDRAGLRGTVQNDIIKEYLSRGTYIFPPDPAMRLTRDVIEFTCREVPQWNPTNICSYHLQEAGATPVQELAFALATAIEVLDTVKQSPHVSADDFPEIVGRISFFVNAGLKFITEMCKMRAFVELWDEICLERYDVQDPRFRKFRYGVQVNSLGLTEQQPENNVYRILIEMLAVTLSKKARARAVQLPAWNEALGLPRSWDQQWSLRMQQILAYETDLLDYDDIFEGAPVIDSKVEELKNAAREELNIILEMGGAVAAVESSYMKAKLVQSNSERLRKIETQEQIVVGVNRWVESEPSPLSGSLENITMSVPEDVEQAQIASLAKWRSSRDSRLVQKALEDLAAAARLGNNVMEPSIACAKAGATTGEWGQVMRDVFGEYRAPTGVSAVSSASSGDLQKVREKVDRISQKLGRRLKFLVGKPGLDGHSNGAEQIAVRARDCGMEVVYEGIRLTPAEIVNTAVEEDVHIIGLSILSGSHLPLVKDVMDRLKGAGLDKVPVIIGGIIPSEDEDILRSAGVAAVYTPKDFQVNDIMENIVEFVDQTH
jgi:(2R)-ethylmalonyl-CoA mutase